MNHVMIDIETMGKLPTAPIISIGACYFDPLTGKIGGTFYQPMNWRTQSDEGRVCETDTAMWWLRQPEVAQQLIIKDVPTALKGGLENLTIFLSELDPLDCLWSTGMLIDIGVLEHAYRQCDLEKPWNYRQLRCARTMIDLAVRLQAPKPERKGIPHHPLEDCKWQVQGVHAVWKELFLTKV